MQVNANAYHTLEQYSKNTNLKQELQTKTEQKEKSVDELINESALKVSISMNAQFMAFLMESSTKNQTNTTAQSELFNFLSGGKTSDGMSLESIGYTGKPISQLSQSEAKALVSEDGFFGVTQTSDRMAGFVLSYAGDNLELLQKGREGVVRGFEEAKNILGDAMADISYQTQERTLELIDEKINSLKGDLA